MIDKRIIHRRRIGFYIQLASLISLFTVGCGATLSLITSKRSETNPTANPNAQMVVVGGGPSVIEGRIDGDFEGFEGETVVKLMDGSIWEQEEYYYHYHYGYMLPVVVFQSSGGWKMQVEGIPKAVRVQRIR